MSDLNAVVLARRLAHPHLGAHHIDRGLRPYRIEAESIEFTDDDFMSARNTESLHAFYAGAPRTMKRFAPADLGLRRVGHFGFFRPEVAESIWRPHLLPELAAR